MQQLSTIMFLLVAGLVTAERKVSVFPSLRHRHHQSARHVAAHAAVQVPAPKPVTPAVQLAAQAVSAAPEEANPALDAGSGGFPELPAVSAIMGGAAETMKDINSQASVLQARLTQTQMENEAKMARQKTIFEQKLKQQETDSRAVAQQNGKTSGEIAVLRKNNEVLKAHSKELQAGNRVMRTELKMLQSRATTVQDFLAASLKSTNDAGAKELAVLFPEAAKAMHEQTATKAVVEKNVAKNHDEDDDGDDEGDDSDDEAGTSLLATSMKVRRASAELTEGAETSEIESLFAGASQATQGNPKELLDVLSSGVQKLQEEEKESESKLKAMFLSAFKAGVKRRGALIQQQTALNATRTSLQTLQSELHTAEDRLESTKSQLQQRVKAVGNFMQGLAHLALTPLGADTASIMRAVPTTVEAVPAAAVAAGAGADAAAVSELAL